MSTASLKKVARMSCVESNNSTENKDPSPFALLHVLISDLTVRRAWIVQRLLYMFNAPIGVIPDETLLERTMG